MLQAAVLHAARHVRHRWATDRVAAEATAEAAVVAHAKHVRCTPRHAQAVATRLRYPSSLAATSPYTAAIVIRHSHSHPVAATVVVVQATAASVVHAGSSTLALKCNKKDACSNCYRHLSCYLIH